MSHPHSPAAPRWQIACIIMTAATGLLVTVYVVLLAATDLEAHSAASRIVFSLIVVLIAATVAVDRRANTHNIKTHVDRRAYQVAAQVQAHVDHRVVETAERMDRRLTSIGNAMIEHGITLDDTTGEIAKVRVAFEGHTHPPQFGGYDRGFTDGLAAAKVHRVTARATVGQPPDPPAEVLPSPTTVAAMRRLARKVTDD